MSLCVLAPIWLPRPLIRFEAVPARLILGWGAMETRCGVVKVSLLEIILEDDGVTMELPPIVLRFLSVRTVLPELLDLFLPVGAVAVMEGSGNLTTIGTLKFRTGSRQECTYLDTEETLFPEDIPAVEALDWRVAMFTD